MRFAHFVRSKCCRTVLRFLRSNECNPSGAERMRSPRPLTGTMHSGSEQRRVAPFGVEQENGLATKSAADGDRQSIESRAAEGNGKERRNGRSQNKEANWRNEQ